MKRFQFNLQAVLTLRQREEQKAMEAYAKELLGRQQALVRLGEVESELDHARAAWKQSASAGCSAYKLVQAQLSYTKLSERRDLCARHLSEAERRTNAALNAMLAVRQQRRIVDKYYDKRRAEYDHDVMTMEQKESDELAGRGRLGGFTNQLSTV
jgi:flagellar export protein FliJ